MKKRYEMIREIFNKCSGNQMRDVFFQEIETEDPDGFVAAMYKGCGVTPDETGGADGTRVYEIEADGLRQRVSLTEV